MQLRSRERRLILRRCPCRMWVGRGQWLQTKPRVGGGDGERKCPKKNPSTPAARACGKLPKITITTDTRDILAHAAKRSATTIISSSMSTPMSPRPRSGLKSSTTWTATSTDRWRGPSRIAAARRPASLNTTPGMLYQDVFGRIPHQQRLASGRRRPHPRAGHAGAARHGHHGHRLHGGVPDPDAGARHASAGRGGSRHRQRLSTAG